MLANSLRVVVGIVALGLSLLSQSAVASVWGTSAVGELTGSRSSAAGGGFVGYEAWDNGVFDISWNITALAGNLWQFVYTVDVTAPKRSKDVSHFILEVTQIPNGGFIIEEGSSAPLEGPKTWTHMGNIALPNAFYDVKFNYGDSLVTYTLITPQAPVYGVFGAKDGKDGGDDFYAYCSALAFSDFKTSTSLTINDFIVRPNGLPTDNGGVNGGGGSGQPIPAPAAVSARLVMLAGFLIRRRMVR